MLESVLFWGNAVVALVVCGLISHSLLRTHFRSKFDPQLTRTHPVLEIIWTVVPIIILMALLALTYQARLA